MVWGLAEASLIRTFIILFETAHVEPKGQPVGCLRPGRRASGTLRAPLTLASGPHPSGLLILRAEWPASRPRSPESADPRTATAFSGLVLGSTFDNKVNPRNTWFSVLSPGLLLGEGFPDTPHQGTCSHTGLVLRQGSALNIITVGMLCVPLAEQWGPQGKNRVLFTFVMCTSHSIPDTD